MVPMVLQHIAFLLLLSVHVVWLWNLVNMGKLATVQGVMWAIDVIAVVVLMWAHVEEMKRQK